MELKEEKIYYPKPCCCFCGKTLVDANWKRIKLFQCICKRWHIIERPKRPEPVEYINQPYAN